MKKISIFVLCALLTVSLWACAEKDPYVQKPSTLPPSTETLPIVPTDPTAPTEPDERFDPALCADVIGVWYREVDLDGKLMGVPDMDTMMRIRLVWTFGDNGIYTVAPENSYQEMIAEFEYQLIDRMIESRRLIFVAEARLEGMSKKEANKLWEEGEVLLAQVECAKAVSSLDLVGQFGKLSAAGAYYVEGDQLHMALNDGTQHIVTFDTATDELIFRTSDHAQMYQSVGLSFPMFLVGTPSLPPLPTIPTLPSVPTEPSTVPSEPSEEPTKPSEEPTEPSVDISGPSVDPSQPSEDISEPSEEPSGPSEDIPEPSDESSEGPGESSEDIPEPSEGPGEPSEEPPVTE